MIKNRIAGSQSRCLQRFQNCVTILPLQWQCIYASSGCSPPLLTFSGGGGQRFKFYPFSRRVVVVSHCSFNLHLPGDKWCRALFSCLHWLSSFVKCVQYFRLTVLRYVSIYISVFMFWGMWNLRVSSVNTNSDFDTPFRCFTINSSLLFLFHFSRKNRKWWTNLYVLYERWCLWFFCK